MDCRQALDGWDALPAGVVERLLEYVARTDDVVGVADDAGRVLYLNQASRKRLGLAEDGLNDLTTADLFPPEAFQLYFDEIRPAILHRGSWTGLVPFYAAGRAVSQLWMTVVGESLPGGEVSWLVTSGRDVAEWISAGETLSWQAHHDDLTGLIRRAVLFDRLEVALAQARRAGTGVAVVYLDVDSLKWVNDSFGHAAGDEVLKAVARRATAAVRDSDTIARVGGDEFVALLPGVGDGAEVDELAARLLRAVTHAPVEVGGLALPLGLTLGVAVGGGDSDPADLVSRADASMLEAKRQKHQIGSDRPSREDLDRPSPHEVSAALTQRLIGPVYQRVIDLRTGRTAGYQAQARWGTRPASEFIDLIEGSGMILSLDLAMLRRASADAATWSGRDWRVYAHASARFLAEPRMEWYLRDILDRARLDADRLWLNVSEHLLVRSTPAFSDAIAAIRDLGAHLALSDAGLLSPPMSELAAGPFEELRLAAPLVSALDGGASIATRTLAGVIALAHGLGMEAHAVAVDGADKLAQLTELGCDLAEGFTVGPLEPAVAVQAARL